MTYSLLNLKNKTIFIVVILIIAFFTCLSSQAFTKNPSKTLGPKKNKYSNKVTLSSSVFNLKNPKIIDSKYLNYQSDLAYIKMEASVLDDDSTKAFEYLKTAQVFAPQSLHLQERQADLYKQEGLITEAIYHYKQLEYKSVNKNKFREKLLECYLLNGLYQKAIEQNNQLLKHANNSYSFLLKKATLLSLLNKKTESLNMLAELKKQKLSLQQTIQVLLFETYTFYKLKDEKKLLQNFKEISDIGFPQEHIALRIADFYVSLNEKQWAANYLNRFQDERGASPAVTLFLLDMALTTSSWDQAFYYTQLLEDLGELKEEHYFYKAVYLMDYKKYKQAILYLKDLISSKPEHGQYHYMLANSYRQNTQWEKAIASYNQVPSYSPYYLVSHLQTAVLLQEQGRYKKSFTLLNKLAFGKKLSPQAVFVYAESLWKIGETKRAMLVLSKALKKQPLHYDLLQLRASYFKQLGKTDFAAKDMNQALKIKKHKQSVSFLN